MTAPAIASALEHLELALGAPNVIVDPTAIGRLARDTSWIEGAPAAIARPATTEEVQATARIAARFGVTLWPYGGGKNWGYGGSIPLDPGSIALDLSRMNRIVELDEELAYVVLEPGVTFRQLHEHLRERSSGLSCSVTDGPPDGSVIGNALDRGIGSSPYGDHVANLVGLQAVLPDGTLVDRDPGAPGSRTTYTHRYGLGPFTDGLFAQANYGIVTRSGVWLMPTPERTAVFILRLADDRLAPALDGLRRLALRDTVRSRVRVLNAQGFFGYLDGVAGAVPLARRSDEELDRLRSRHGAPPWIMMGGLYGTVAEVDAQRRAVSAELGHLGALQTIRLDRVGHLEALIRRLDRPSRLPFARRGLEALLRRAAGASVDVLRVQPHLLRLWQGVPTERNVAFAYGRAGRPAPDTDLDPARDGCGKVWFSPIVPLVGSQVTQVLAAGDELFRQHGFDFNVYMIAVNPRSIVALMTIVYSRTIPGEESRARDLYGALRARIRGMGYEQYRVGLWSMGEAMEGSAGRRHMARAIKDAVDPAGILAPGKYGI